jgi:hypothetical protein
MTTNIKTVLVDLRKEAHVPINRMFQALYLEIVKTTPRATGAASRAWTRPEIVSPDDFSAVITTNRLPYVERLEGGWSKQAPDGFIQPSIDKIVRRYNK